MKGVMIWALSRQPPYNRQQLADYLNVERSALSNELSLMQRDGLIRYEKSHFAVTEQLG